MEDRYYSDIKDALTKCCSLCFPNDTSQTAASTGIFWSYCATCEKLIYAVCRHGTVLLDKRKEHKHE
jgi:hypothetical protein